MKRFLAVLLAVGSLAACADTERVTVDGVDCIRADNGMGEVTAISCDWSDR